MDTLYDLLGALPRDDAEGLRIAFRRAVKAIHPDLNPGDPDAGQKFRQIVRAQEILLDGEQRAVYDHLLALARVEATEDAEQAAEHARAGKVHRLASWVMALAGASAVSIAGLALVALLWTSTEPSADTELTADEAAPTEVATVPEQALPEPTAPAETVSPAPTAPAETSLPVPTAPSEASLPAPTAPDDGTLPPLGPPLDITPPPPAQMSDRTHGFDRAFAAISHVRHPDKAGHAANARKKGSDAVEGGPKPTPPRRTAANDPSRRESAAFDPRP